jgi:hypothetical protein
LKTKVVLLAVVLTATAFGGAIGVLNLTTLPANTYSGYYVGPSKGTFNGGPSIDLTCVDFFLTTGVPSSFLVEEQFMSELSGADRDNTIRAAWLLQQVATSPGEIGPIQFAIWNLFAPAAPDPGNSASWLAAAMAIKPSNYDASGLYLLVPTNSANQRFFGGELGNPVPEPGTLSAMGVGFIALAFLSRRSSPLRR